MYISPDDDNCSFFTYKKNFRLGFAKSDLRFPHVVLMEHKSNHLLILYKKKISELGVELRLLEEKRNENFMGLTNFFSKYTGSNESLN